MKFLIVFACALAAASAGHLVAPVYPGAQHLPVIGANGVPVDTPAVQHAAAAHHAHKVEAHARNGDFAAPIAGPAFAAPIAPIAGPAFAAPVAPLAPAYPAVGGQAYPTTLGVPAVTGNGVPLETPEVAAAKSAHFAAHGEALARTGHAYEHQHEHAYGHYVAKRGVYATPFAYAAPAYSYAGYGHHHLYKRGVYTTPFAYATPAYGYHHLYKRGVYAPVAAYSHAYTGAYPYAHYY